MIDSVGRTRQAIEVLAQDLARQENRADAKASPVNLGRNEVLISFVLLGLADVSDWRLVDITARSGDGILGDEDFRAHCIGYANRKCDFVADSDRLRKKTGQQKLGLIGEHAGSRHLICRWMLTTRSRHTGMDGLKDARAMLSAGSIGLPCGTAKRRSPDLRSSRRMVLLVAEGSDSLE